MNAPTPYQSAPKTSGLAISSLVLGILSLTCFSILTAIPGAICGHMALSRINRSGGATSGQGLAIGGLVTSYLGIALALLIIPIMCAIAIPNFVRARATAQKNICINHLRQFDAAKQQWALDNQKDTNAVPTLTDLARYLKTGPLTCPAGGVYKLNAVGELPTCTIPNHALVD